MDPTDTEGLDLHHIAPLSDDTIPDQNQAHFCMSCEHPMKGLFCAQCGQKNDDYRRSIFSLVKEFITSITAIESRIWRTWATLIFKPGKVARQFANGRRAYWSSPIRVYLAMSILLFGFMSLTNTHLFSIDIDATVKEGVNKPFDELAADEIETKFSFHAFETQAQIDARNTDRNFELIQRKLSLTGKVLNLNVGPSGITASNKGEVSEEDKETAVEALDNLKDRSPEPVTDVINQISDAIEEANAEGDPSKAQGSGVIVNGQQIEQSDWIKFTTQFMKNPAVLTRSFNTWLPRLMFFMMPFTMLIGAMFIRGRGNALLYDHLVHAAYIHAFAFFLLFSGILLARVFPGDAVGNLIVIGLLIYLPLSLKGMFRRGWVKTVWTAYGVGAIYLFVLFVAMTLLILRDMSSSFLAAL